MNQTKTHKIMKTYKIISTKNQGIYSEGELIRNITTNNIAEYYGLENDKLFNINKVNSDNSNLIKIIEL